MVLPLARSTITACRLTVESTVPRPAPNMNSEAINAGTDDTVASRGRAVQINTVPPIITRRQPKRADNAPASGIAKIEPTPRHNNSKPSVPSSIPARALAYGTSGAQAAMPKPAMKKATRVAICCWRPGTKLVWVLRLVISIPGQNTSRAQGTMAER
ncbi:hypothetical protein D3C73_986190 [compost metagenome]